MMIQGKEKQTEGFKTKIREQKVLASSVKSFPRVYAIHFMVYDPLSTNCSSPICDSST